MSPTRERLLYGTPAIWWVTLAASRGVVLAAIALALGGLRARRLRSRLPLGSCCVPARIPLRASLDGGRRETSRTATSARCRAAELRRLSAYLRAHQGGAHYETAYDAATQMGALVVRDGRPVLLADQLQRAAAHPRRSSQRLIAAGGVRYAFLTALSGSPPPRTDADCSAPAAWVRAHGDDVSAARRPSVRDALWLLPGAVA